MDNNKNDESLSDEILTQIVDLDELLRLLCGASDDDVCSRGLYVALMQAQAMTAQLRKMTDRKTAK